jgi:hypothetical protein
LVTRLSIENTNRKGAVKGKDKAEMYKTAIAACGLLALSTLVQGTNSFLSSRARETEAIGSGGGPVATVAEASGVPLTIDRLPLRFLPSSEIVNRQHLVAQGGNTSCSNTSGFQIESQSDLDALASCSTVTGNIVVTAVDMDAVNIPQGVLHVNGDISVSLTSSIVTFSAPGLESISGTLELLNLTALTSLNAPSLTSVGGINFVILPLFTTMTFGINQAGNILISDTQLSTLDGFSLTSLNDFDISNTFFCELFLTIRQQSLPHDDFTTQFEGS